MTRVIESDHFPNGTVKIIEASPPNGIPYLLDLNHGTQIFTGKINDTHM